MGVMKIGCQRVSDQKCITSFPNAPPPLWEIQDECIEFLILQYQNAQKAQQVVGCQMLKEVGGFHQYP